MTPYEIINSVWAPFTESEREIVLFVFRVFITLRKHPMASQIAEELLIRLFNELEEFERLDNNGRAGQTETITGTSPDAA